MPRKISLERCDSYDDYLKYARQHGCSVRQGKGTHVVVDDAKGRRVTTMTTHGEPGPHTRSALRKLLSTLVVMAILFGTLAVFTYAVM